MAEGFSEGVYGVISRVTMHMGGECLLVLLSLTSLRLSLPARNRCYHSIPMEINQLAFLVRAACFVVLQAMSVLKAEVFLTHKRLKRGKTH
jgi:hypothetical protein